MFSFKCLRNKRPIISFLHYCLEARLLGCSAWHSGLLILPSCTIKNTQERSFHSPGLGSSIFLPGYFCTALSSRAGISTSTIQGFQERIDRIEVGIEVNQVDSTITEKM